MDEKNTNLSIENETSKKKKSGCLKGCLTPIVIFIIIAGLIGSCFGDESTDDANSNEEPVATKADSQSKEKNKTEEVENNEATAEEIEFYKSKLGPELDKIQKEYDRIWNEQWVTTFNGISDGSVNVYDAYKTMTFIDTNYDVLSDNIGKINGDALSKENKKLLKNYMSKLNEAAKYRSYAASEAAKMFDNGNFKPSEFDSIKTIVSMADKEMMSAIVDRLSIESNLGLIENKE